MEAYIINDLKNLGVNYDSLSNQDKTKLDQGQKTGLLKLSILDSTENRDLLKNENIPFQGENGQLNFEGKVSALKTLTTDNTYENKELLKNNEIKFKEEGNKLTLDNKNIKKFAIAALVLINPLAAIVLLLYPKRNEIKNDKELSKEEIKHLKTGETLAKTDKNNERVLLQVDRETNELVSVKLKDIQVPDKINGVNLSPIQKENLKNGKEITIENDQTKITSTIKIDLNKATGLDVKNEKQEDRSLLNKVVSTGQNGIKYTVESIQNGKAKLEQLDNKDYGVSKTQIVDLELLKNNCVVHENKEKIKNDMKPSESSEKKSRSVKI